MELTCYVYPGWAPRIRAASSRRPWMDDTPDSFAYRCLPLNIANAHGWEILNPRPFSAYWNGGTDIDGVKIRLGDAEPGAMAPVSLFGNGVLTFHVEGLFRTPPAWNLWVGGSPNAPKDAIYPLTGIIETDWAPFTFTMNWRFTRQNHWVRFERHEPICFLFPLQRGGVEAFRPQVLPMESDPETAEQFRLWSQARDQFHRKMATDPPSKPADRWQKHYYQGADMTGEQQRDDHQTRLRLPDFVRED
jgi:hypothetical protein